MNAAGTISQSPGGLSVGSGTLTIDPATVGVTLQAPAFTTTVPDPLQVAFAYWVPQSVPAAQPVPVVLIMHGRIDGNSEAADSYLGFAYLGQYLASYGFAAFSAQLPEKAAWAWEPTGDWALRATACLKWLAALPGNTTAPAIQLATALQGTQLDMSRVGVIGHSNGGANMITITADPAYQIQAFIGLAPALIMVGGESTKSLAFPAGAAFQIIHGSRDCLFGPAYGGWGKYEGLLASPNSVLKSWVLIQNGTHNLFNSNWYDERNNTYTKVRQFSGCNPVTDPPNQANTQQQVTLAYAYAFLQVTLNGDATYLPYLSGGVANPVVGWNAIDPDYVNVRLDFRAPGADILLIDNFEGAAGVNALDGGTANYEGSEATTLSNVQSWTGPPPLKAVVGPTATGTSFFLGEGIGQSWQPPPDNAYSLLSFRVGQVENSAALASNAPIQLTIVAYDRKPHGASVQVQVPPPWAACAPELWHTFLQVVRIPLSQFTGAFGTSGVDFSQLFQLQFGANLPAGVSLAIDEILFSST